MPLGALMCKSIDKAIAHRAVIDQPGPIVDALRLFVDGAVTKGDCLVIKGPATVVVVDVDLRGYAKVDYNDAGQWWTDAENLWGYFGKAEKLRAWKKP